MISPVTAIVEGGLLRRINPLPLADGTRVELIIMPGKKALPDPQMAATLLAAIAALPTEGGDRMTSVDHDKILYGEQGAK